MVKEEDIASVSHTMYNLGCDDAYITVSEEAFDKLDSILFPDGKVYRNMNPGASDCPTNPNVKSYILSGVHIHFSKVPLSSLFK